MRSFKVYLKGTADGILSELSFKEWYVRCTRTPNKQTNKQAVNHHSVEVRPVTSSKIAVMALNVPIDYDTCLVWRTVSVQTNDVRHRTTAH